MNALVSYKWLSEFVDLAGIAPDDFAKRVSLCGPAVEKIYPRGELLDRVVVGRVDEVKAHPNADKLRVVIVDIGDKKIHLVCGGTNVVQGQFVAVALSGARVRWHGEGEPIVLEPTEIRGVKSDGMICGASEIGLADAFPHAEREIFDLSQVGFAKMPSPGTPLAHALGLNGDVVMDIEVTTNRVDAMGMVGLAREASAIFNRKMLWKSKSLPRAKGKSVVAVNVKSKKACPRYMAARIDGVKVGPSPWWVKQRLLSAGLNSINNIVDATNLVMLELAQPLHAFDATAVEKHIDVRFAKDGEKITALDGKEYALDESSLVIADAAQPIAIAGIMGGKDSGVTDATTSVILEAATFDPVSVRRTARRLNIQTDAQQRFEKGLSTEAPPIALARLVELVLELAGGNVAGAHADVSAAPYHAKKFSVTTDEVNALIGVAIPVREMVRILQRLGFVVSSRGKRLNVTIPWWRDVDIEDGRDLIEEIARVYGFGNIPSVIPVGVAAHPMSAELVWEDVVKDIGKAAGLLETFSYSFVSRDVLAKAGYDATKMLRVVNPLSADMEIMRTTLLPSLLQIAAENQERESDLRLFEVANVYYPHADGWKELPDEQLELGAIFVGMDKSWSVAKGFVEHVLQELGIQNVRWERLSTDSFWHPGRTAQAFVGEDLLATVGEISPKIAQAFKFDARVAMVDMPLERVFNHATTRKMYTPLPTFPVVKRDLAVMVDTKVSFADVAKVIASTHMAVTNVEWFDTYTGTNVPAGQKSLAMHLTIASPERTLESKEVDEIMAKVIDRVGDAFKAQVRTA